VVPNFGTSIRVGIYCIAMSNVDNIYFIASNIILQVQCIFAHPWLILLLGVVAPLLLILLLLRHLPYFCCLNSHSATTTLVKLFQRLETFCKMAFQVILNSMIEDHFLLRILLLSAVDSCSLRNGNGRLGEFYLVVTGVPDPCKNHASAMLLCSTACREKTSSLMNRLSPTSADDILPSCVFVSR
jgi:hypothetical protein